MPKPKLPIRKRKRFDTQITFQALRPEKEAIRNQVDGRKFTCDGDVLRAMMYDFFEKNHIIVDYTGYEQYPQARQS